MENTLEHDIAILDNRLRSGEISEEEYSLEHYNLHVQYGAINPNESIRDNCVGEYQILSIIGHGGMSVVYHCRPLNENQASMWGDVAVKVLHSHHTRDELQLKRFENEADICQKIRHPNIVKVYDDFTQDGDFALVMEKIDGIPLSKLIGQQVGPIPWEERAKDMFRQILDAVKAVHEHGVIHRDIKPANFMVTDNGTVKLLDFGIAKDEESKKTMTGVGMGTLRYMAPEQFQDAKRADIRADIYSLGMTLYEMVAGQLPWKDVPILEIYKQKRKDNYEPPTTFYPNIPDNVEQVIKLALLSDVDQRIQDVSTMARYLFDDVPLPTPPQNSYSKSDVYIKTDTMPIQKESEQSNVDEALKQINNSPKLVRNFAYFGLFTAIVLIGWSIMKGLLWLMND